MNVFAKLNRRAGSLYAGALVCLGLHLLFLAVARGTDDFSSSQDRKTVLVLGDSLAAGYGLELKEAYPALLQKKVDESGWSFTVVNAGVSGDTSSGGLRRIDWVLKRRIDVLVLELGGNDGLRGSSVEAMKANLQGIIDRTRRKYPQAQFVIVGMRMPPNLGEYAQRFQTVFAEVAKENNAALVPFLLDGVGGKPELNLPDLIHPTAEGQKILAENVWKVLRQVLEKMAAVK
jgi:acyl-CoA thioesterase I